jgi:hypothetical protein
MFVLPVSTFPFVAAAIPADKGARTPPAGTRAQWLRWSTSRRSRRSSTPDSTRFTGGQIGPDHEGFVDFYARAVLPHFAARRRATPWLRDRLTP